MKTVQFLLFAFEFPEMAITLFFVAASTIGLSMVLSDLGIDPRPVQIAGALLMIITTLKLMLKMFEYSKERK